SLACSAEPGDKWTFYEIDPAVVQISREENRFTFVSRCTPQAHIILGDARLKLAEAPDGAYNFIVIDAFSSDTIPTHLLTREAMRRYLAKLAPNGVVAMHVSNRHLELASVVLGIAEANGLNTRTSPSAGNGERGPDADYKFSSTVVIVARDPVDFGGLAMPDEWGWPVGQTPAGQWVWTDDYSNLLSAVVRHIRQ